MRTLTRSCDKLATQSVDGAACRSPHVCLLGQWDHYWLPPRVAAPRRPWRGWLCRVYYFWLRISSTSRLLHAVRFALRGFSPAPCGCGRVGRRRGMRRPGTVCDRVCAVLRMSVRRSRSVFGRVRRSPPAGRSRFRVRSRHSGKA